MKIKLLCLFICVSAYCHAQSDTTLVFFAKDGHETTPDSGYTQIKFYKQNNVWHGKEYYKVVS